MYDPIRAADVFVSYAAHDLSVAKSLTASLAPKGVTTWVANVDIRPGESWADAIYHALNLSQVVVFLLSQASIKSEHVLRELDMALDLKKRVIPIRLENLKLEGAFYYFTRGLQFYDWNSDPTTAIERIVEQVSNARLAQSRTTPDADAAVSGRDDG